MPITPSTQEAGESSVQSGQRGYMRPCLQKEKENIQASRRRWTLKNKLAVRHSGRSQCQMGGQGTAITGFWINENKEWNFPRFRGSLHTSVRAYDRLVIPHDLPGLGRVRTHCSHGNCLSLFALEIASYLFYFFSVVFYFVMSQVA